MSRNDHLNDSEDRPDDEGIPDFPEADIPDFPEEDTPACPIPSQPSRFLSSPGSPRPAPPQNSMPGWDMAKTMCQAGGASLDKVTAAAEEDGDEPPWTQQSASSGQTIVLRADRFHRRNIQNPKPKEECMGIKVNIWNRAKVRRYSLDEIR